MNSVYKHTFAICAYKESSFLEKCILSLKNQTMKSNIIMITSTPNKYICEISKKNDIELYINEKGGITQDWNFAYNKADSKYVTITHQDDIYAPEYVESIVNVLEKSNQPIIAFTDYFEIRNGKKIRSNKLLKVKRVMLSPLLIKRFYKSIRVRRMILSLGCPICCPSVTFVKERVGNAPFQHGFRSDEDWEAWERLSKFQGEFVYIPRMLVGHRIHEESETTNILGDNARKREDIVMFSKFWPKPFAELLEKIYSLSEKSNEL